MTFDSAGLQKSMKIYRKSEVIFEEGSFGSEMYIIHSGKVQIYRDSEEGEIELLTLGPGKFFGEMALVDNAARSASARAAEEGTRLIALDKDKFLFLVSHQPTFALVVMQAHCERIRALSESVSKADLPQPLEIGT